MASQVMFPKGLWCEEEYEGTEMLKLEPSVSARQVTPHIKGSGLALPCVREGDEAQWRLRAAGFQLDPSRHFGSTS